MMIQTKPEPYCPDCGAKMKLRRPRPNARTQFKPFWGCSQFPNCHGWRAADRRGREGGRIALLTLLNANAVHIPLDDNCVQVTVTSPPYLGLRAYPGVEPTIWPAIEYTPMVGLPSIFIPGDGEREHIWGKELPKSGRVSHGQGGSTLTGGHDSWGERDGAAQGQFCQRCGAWRGVLGNEPSPTMYIAHLVLIFREIRRVLHPSGTVWLNLGDSYSQGGGKQVIQTKNASHGLEGMRAKTPNMPAKQLLGIPWRVALALQADGWWLRSDCIWRKPNSLPESVTDRPTKAHEYLFLLSKNKTYFYDAEAIREKSSGKSITLSSGRADCAALGGSALRPKLSATLYANDGALGTWGRLDFGQSEVSINDAMTTETEHFQIVKPIGLKIGVKAPEGCFVMNLQSGSLATPLANVIVSLQNLFSLGGPIHPLVPNLTAAPSGAILSRHIDTNPFAGTLTGAEVVSLECALIPSELFAACITFKHEECQFALFVWTSFWSSQVSLAPVGLKSIIPQNSAGRNRRSVWTLPTAGFAGSHFAVFPEKLVEPCVRAGVSEKGCCPRCKAPWERVMERATVGDWRSTERSRDLEHGAKGGPHGTMLGYFQHVTIGWRPTCTCDNQHSFPENAPDSRCVYCGHTWEETLRDDVPCIIPCLVLDPFCGSGTTGIVARKEGCDFVGLDASREYIGMARQRLELDKLKTWEKGTEPVKSNLKDLPLFGEQHENMA